MVQSELAIHHHFVDLPVPELHNKLVLIVVDCREAQCRGENRRIENVKREIDIIHINNDSPDGGTVGQYRRVDIARLNVFAIGLIHMRFDEFSKGGIRLNNSYGFVQKPAFWSVLACGDDYARREGKFSDGKGDVPLLWHYTAEGAKNGMHKSSFSLWSLFH